MTSYWNKRRTRISEYGCHGNTKSDEEKQASKHWLSVRGNMLSTFLVTSVPAGALFATQSPGGYHNLGSWELILI